MSVKVTSYTAKAIKANGEGTLNGLLKTAVMVTSQAKALCPVDKGELRGSIMWRGGGKTGGLEKGEALSIKPKSGYVVGTNTEYAGYVEYGTRRAGAQPFLRPAINILVKGMTATKAMAKSMMESVKKGVPK